MGTKIPASSILILRTVGARHPAGLGVTVVPTVLRQASCQSRSKHARIMQGIKLFNDLGKAALDAGMRRSSKCCREWHYDAQSCVGSQCVGNATACNLDSSQHEQDNEYEDNCAY
jgi:hypothetical protein